MTAPLVSIGMPVLNGGEELPLAVRSVAAQTMGDWELLVMDDGSDDGATEAVAAIGDPRIRVIVDGKNKGIAARLNQAVDLARGRYFARMDHDDIAHPERLRLQLAALDADPGLDLVGCRCITMTEDRELVGYLPFAARHQDICRHPWLRIPLAHPSWTGRIEWFSRHRYADPAPYYAEDFELLLRAHHASKYAALPATLMAYRIRRRIDWARSTRARMVQFSVQRDHYLSRGEHGKVLMAGGALLLRLLMDGSLLAVQSSRVTVGLADGVDPADRAEWLGIIERIGRIDGHSEPAAPFSTAYRESAP